MQMTAEKHEFPRTTVKSVSYDMWCMCGACAVHVRCMCGACAVQGVESAHLIKTTLLALFCVCS